MSNNNNYNNQIYSNLPDKSIFGSSLSGQQFKDLFNHLENGNSKITKNKMQKIVDMAKQLHKDQEVEDAYICIYYFLNQIRKQLFDSEKEEFDQNFLLKFCDQLECKDCKQKIQNTQDQYTFQQYESFGQKCISFSQTFSSQGDKGLFQEVNPDLICDICKSNNFSTRREYQVAPNFMMIRLLKFDKQPNNNYENNFLEQQFKLPVQGQQFPEKYQIIGFCGFQFYRYKYFAKYDSEWLEFNDHFTYSLFSPNYSNATYFILKKIYCNAEVTQERQFNEKSSKQINMNILKKYNNQYQQMGYQQVNFKTNTNLKTNILNENYQSKIQLKQEYQISLDNKTQSFVDACIVLPFLGNKQYMIPLIQTLIQVYYFFDEDLFGSSNSYNQEFKNLIQIMKERDISNIQQFIFHNFVKIKQNIRNPKRLIHIFLKYSNKQ